MSGYLIRDAGEFLIDVEGHGGSFAYDVLRSRFYRIVQLRDLAADDSSNEAGSTPRTSPSTLEIAVGRIHDDGRTVLRVVLSWLPCSNLRSIEPSIP